MEGMEMISFTSSGSREGAVELLRNRKTDVVVVLPPDLSASIAGSPGSVGSTATLELIGDVTQMEYIVGAVWTEEMINQFLLEAAEIRVPFNWKETTLGFSGERSYFELYLPGLLILSIIMIIFSASAALVVNRDPHPGTSQDFKTIRSGISVGDLTGSDPGSCLLPGSGTANRYGTWVYPDSRDPGIYPSDLDPCSHLHDMFQPPGGCHVPLGKGGGHSGNFPLFLLMFFTGAAFPIRGGYLFSLGEHQVMLNDILSPTHAVEALNKVLIRGQDVRETFPEMIALVVLTLLYALAGSWAFRRRHMRAR